MKEKKVKLKDLTYKELCAICHNNLDCRYCPLYVKFTLFKKECYHAARLHGEKITKRAKNKKIKIKSPWRS